MSDWDYIRHASQTFLEGFVGRRNDALTYARGFADVDSGDEKLVRVMGALIGSDEFVNFLIPRFNHLDAFRVKPFALLSLYKPDYTLLAGIPD